METEFLKLLKKRLACRAISAKPVDPAHKRALMEAAQLSASCMNNQPWRFLMLDEAEALEEGRSALSPGNAWARTAPLLIAGFSRSDLDCHPVDGREYHLFDLGMAVQNILLQATELGLVARPMAGFRPDMIRRSFRIPDDFAVVVLIAVGEPGDLDTLDEKPRAVSLAPRVRGPLENNFFMNRFAPGEDGGAPD